jgi:hypothetical protein
MTTCRSLPFLVALGLLLPGGTLPLTAEEPVRLQEQFPVGYEYHVSIRTELSGSLTLPAEKGKPAPKPLAVAGDSAIDYDERVLDTTADGAVRKTVRIYRRMDLERKVGDRPQQSTLRPGVRRLVLLRRDNLGVPFSPDGPLTWGEIDLVRTDVFTPALAGLLPDKPVRPGDHWTARASALEQQLTALEHIDEGSVECRLEQIATLEKRRYARVTLSGTVRGTNEDGPDRQVLDGYFFFDLESQHVSYLYLKGVNIPLDKDGKELGRLEGSFVLTRQAHTAARDLTDEALKGVVLEPNAENSRLLYDNPELGIRFLYPRRWRVAGVHGRQLGIDAADGSGVLLTVEPPARVPTGAQFLAESQTYLQEQKAKVLRTDAPRQLQAAPQGLEQFGLEVEVGGQRVQMDYYIVKQARGGVTVAARLLPGDLANLRKEVEEIARSLTVTGTITDKQR